jgi:Zn-dependent protease
LRGPFGGRAFYLFRIFGIDVGLDPSWLIIFLLVTLSLRGEFAGPNHEWPSRIAWAAGVATSLLFFLSLLLHELGHSVTSNKLGLPVHSITLFIFGGVARLTREPDRPRDEFLIAVAGPAVSVFLGVAFFFVWALASQVGAPIPDSTAESVHWRDLVASMSLWLARINLVLVVFNCIPGFPLDGGRILRSFIWAATGSYDKATRWASAGGAAFAYFLIAAGIWIAFITQGGFVSGLWLVFIGWFLLGAARSSVIQLVFRDSLSEIRVGEVYDEACVRLPGSMSVKDLIDSAILRHGHRTFFAESADGGIGLVTLQEVKNVPAEERESTPLQSIAAPLNGLRRLSVGDTLWDALQQMDEAGFNQLPVVEDGRLLGVLTRERLLRIVRNRMEFR